MSDEIELGSFSSGLGIGDEFFNNESSKDEFFLLPLISELAHKCEGLIKEPGIYSFKLQVNKLK